MRLSLCLFACIWAFAWHPQLYSCAALSTESWMSDIKDYVYNYTLLEITVPGTHDSGMHMYIDVVGPGESVELAAMIKLATQYKVPLYPFIGNWAISQDTTFYEQLMGGIRYLDLRACIHQGMWYTEHFLLGVPTQDLLDDIKRFVSNHSGEVIIVQVGDLAGSTKEERVVLAKMIGDTLGGYMANVRQGGFGNFTIGEMVQTGQQIVVIYPGAGEFQPPYEFYWDQATYLEGEYANKDKVVTMEAWNVGEINKYGGHGKLFELSWTLTTQISDIEKTLVDPDAKPRTLKELALIADAALPDFTQKYKNYKLGNMLLVDFWDSSIVVPAVIANNMRMCNDDPNFIAVNSDGQYCRQYFLNNNCTDADFADWMSVHCRLSCGFC